MQTPRLLACAATILLCGCVPTQHARARADSWWPAQSPLRIALYVQAKARVATRGEISYESLEAGRQVRERVTRSLVESLSHRGFRALPIGVDSVEPDLEDARLLAEAVIEAVSAMHYGPKALEGRPFSYELGPLGSILERAGADLLLGAWAASAVSTPTLGMRDASVEDTSLYLALFDREGRLLWIHRAVREEEALLADDMSTARLVEDLLSELPGGAP